MCANSENHDRFLSLFTALIESSFRHTTEHVTREIICLRFVVLSETVENKIISHFWFCLPSPENHSITPSNGIYFYKNFWPLLAICYGDLWISWICWVVYTIVAICPAPGWILCLNMLKTSSKVTSPHEKSNWSVCFKSFLLICGQMFLLCFFPD